MSMGHVQMLVLGFVEPEFTEKSRPRSTGSASTTSFGSSTRLSCKRMTPAISRLFKQVTSRSTRPQSWVQSQVRSSDSVTATPRPEPEAGAAAGEDGHLIPDAEAWYVADVIPTGSTAAIVLLEHLWAIPLRDAIVDAGGVALADEWIHPSDLIAAGLATSGVSGIGLVHLDAPRSTAHHFGSEAGRVRWDVLGVVYEHELRGAVTALTRQQERRAHYAASAASTSRKIRSGST